MIDGEYPAYGNNDERVDEIAVRLVEEFMRKVRRHPTYRDAEHTQSVLTITSNVVYGKKTGNTPDGRRSRRTLLPGRQPDERPRHPRLRGLGPVGRQASVRGRRGRHLADQHRHPRRPGPHPEERIKNLAGVLDGYMASDGFHMNVNVLNRDTLMDAMKHPENYPQLTIRVSGYAVNFVRLTREQQLDVLNRTFHGSL